MNNRVNDFFILENDYGTPAIGNFKNIYIGSVAAGSAMTDFILLNYSSNLFSYYRGGNLTDLVGSNNLNNYNTVTTTTGPGGTSNAAWHFEGSPYPYLFSNYPFTLGSNWTMICQVKLDTQGYDAYMFGMGSGGFDGLNNCSYNGLAAENDNDLVRYYGDAGGNEVVWRNTSEVNWNVLGIQADSTGSMVVLVNSGINLIKRSVTPPKNARVMIGLQRYANGTNFTLNQPMSGNIGFIALWNTNLTSGQMLDIYNNCLNIDVK